MTLDAATMPACCMLDAGSLHRQEQSSLVDECARACIQNASRPHLLISRMFSHLFFCATARREAEGLTEQIRDAGEEAFESFSALI